MKKGVEEWQITEKPDRLRLNTATLLKRHIEKLDGFLEFNDYEILQDAGKISANVAKKLAEEEFEKFRPIQDRAFESDFDKLVEETKKKKV